MEDAVLPQTKKCGKERIRRVYHNIDPLTAFWLASASKKSNIIDRCRSTTAKVP